MSSPAAAVMEAARTLSRAAAAPLIDVREVSVRFGGIVALDRVSFTIAPGDLLGLIGPNGAGKTTLFNCFSRLYTPSAGDILFEGQSILSRPPHRIAEIGIGRTFQNLALFRTMSVLDNVRVGSHPLGRTDFLSNALKLPWTRREEDEPARQDDEDETPGDRRDRDRSPGRTDERQDPVHERQRERRERRREEGQQEVEDRPGHRPLVDPNGSRRVASHAGPRRAPARAAPTGPGSSPSPCCGGC